MGDPGRHRKALKDQVEFFDEPSVEQKLKAQKAIAGHPSIENAEDAALILSMLGLHPDQIKEAQEDEECQKQITAKRNGKSVSSPSLNRSSPSAVGTWRAFN